MRVTGVITVSVLVASVGLLTLTPRLNHTFPSMVDDWYVIDRVPDKVSAALTLRIPEDERYRPGWIVWSALQWHTLGAPGNLTAPLVWWLLRVLVFVAGIVAAALVCAGRAPPTRAGEFARLALAGGAALVVVTVPGFAVDLARHGPQEPLMVGLMCGGGALVAAATTRALHGALSDRRLALYGGFGALVFGAGVMQKESSVCILALVPFLWLGTIEERQLLAGSARRTRRTVAAIFGLLAAPLLVMAARTVQLVAAPHHLYGAEPGEGLYGKTRSLVDSMDIQTGSHVVEVLLWLGIIAVGGLAVARQFEPIATGFLVTGLAFLAFAGQVNVAPSRYYLPTATLAVLGIVRITARMRSLGVSASCASLFVLFSLSQVRDAHAYVASWVSGERQQEQIVDVVGGLRAAGCEVLLAGREVELIEAIPILIPVANPEPTPCEGDQRFVAVLNWHYGEDPDDPVIVGCGRAPRVVMRNVVGRVIACDR
jgi:hypothetical protein